MDITNLWEKLEPKQENIDGIKQDLRAGLVPNLPYFIIGNEDAKKKIGENISKIDTQFSFSYLIANYGNGKTNILRYLEYFFNDKFPERNITVAYWRADIDKYDLIIFLLYIIQVMFKEKLLRAITQLPQKSLDELALLDNGSFMAIKDYVNTIKMNLNDSEKLGDLIDLGTGRKYTKGAFQKFELAPLSDYNRREVLVFFLNILAASHNYIIFAIDELEKIHEKSKARFSSFLTSYRELIDLKRNINGHCIITAATDASGSTLSNINPAFNRRIKDFASSLDVINGRDNITKLTNYLNELVHSKISQDEIGKIIGLLSNRNFSNNNEIVKIVCEKLVDFSKEAWNEKLEEYKLKNLFEAEKEKLRNNGAFDGIYTKFFDSLGRYLRVASETDKYEIKVSERILIKQIQKEVYVFLFSDDHATNENRIRNIALLYPSFKARIWRPLSADVSFDSTDIQIQEIITYNPEDLMSLLDMYYDYYAEYGEKIENIVHLYSNNTL